MGSPVVTILAAGGDGERVGGFLKYHYFINVYTPVSKCYGYMRITYKYIFFNKGKERREGETYRMKGGEKVTHEDRQKNRQHTKRERERETEREREREGNGMNSNISYP